MRLWLDDLRKPPFGYVWVKTYDEAVAALALTSFDGCTTISLDHDLAEEHYSGDFSRAKSGYDIAKFIVENNIKLDYITVHSFNPVGAANMVALLRNAGYVVRRVTPQEMYNE